MRRVSLALSLVILAAALVSACDSGSAERVAEPIPSATPAAAPSPTATTPLLVRGDPRELGLQLEDLPSGFQQVTEEYEAPAHYAVVYFSPEAFAASGPLVAALTAVAASLDLHEDVRGAENQYETQEGLDEDSIAYSMAGTSGGATLVDVQPYGVELEAADRAKAVRVDYTIGSTSVIDYRTRFVVGNAVVNVLATVRVSGTEATQSPLLEEVQAIVEQQAARLAEARE